jgi:hypothetical protein
MEEKYQNKYRIASARWQQWNYGRDAAYFITICTKDRAHFFGEVVDGKMVLSPVGIIADVLWHEIKNHAKNMTLGQFVVMPNHIHGILILDGNGGNVGENDNINVETRHAFLPLPLQPPSPSNPSSNLSPGQNRFQN